MKLFDAVPDRLFSILASPSRTLYAHVLFLLYDLYKLSLFGLERETVIAQVMAYLETENVELTADDLEDVDAGLLLPRDKAAAILRRLQATEWIEVEMRTNYDQYVNLRDYAIKILHVLDGIRRDEQTEYAGYVVATYQALTSAEAEQNPGLMIGTAYDQTRLLVRDLKSLHQNIKAYTERLLRQKKSHEILELHFGEYQVEVLDRAYHRLKTTDNVAKFRPRILERIELWLSDPAWLPIAAADEVRRGRQPTSETAEEVLRQRLQEIRSSYEQMDDLIDEIDRRNAQYARASLEQVRYLITAGRDTESQLVNLLKQLGAELRAGESVDQPWLAEREGLFALFAVTPWSNDSLYKPRRARRTLTSQPLQAPEMSAAERAAARERARLQIIDRLTPKRISDYVLERLGTRSEVSLTELGVATTRDFVRMIYVAAYSQNRHVRYRVDWTQSPEPVELNERRFSLRDLRIRRK